MKRREFVAGFASAGAWPLIVRAQPDDRIRHVGLLFGIDENDPEAKMRAAALREGLDRLGWREGRNVRLEVRSSGGDFQRLKGLAAEMVARRPDVIVASATTALTALKPATDTLPIVFAQVTDPVGAGFVQSLARPGGNITGFTQHEFSIGVKWLELIGGVDHVSVLYDPGNAAVPGYLAAIEAAGTALGVRIAGFAVRGSADIERAVEAAATAKHGGLIVLPGPAPSVRRDEIIALAFQRRLPAVYPFRYWVSHGGLLSYGIDNIDLYRRTAAYVDRILKGEKPSDLPVQHATKFQLVLNVKVAKALALDLPSTLLIRADEVIE